MGAEVRGAPTHEGAADGLALGGSPAGFAFLRRGAGLALLMRWASSGARKLHQYGGGAQVEVLRQEVVLLFGAAQAAAVGVHVEGPLIHETAWGVQKKTRRTMIQPLCCDREEV